MYTGQLNRIPAAGRTAFLLWAALGLSLLAGCGGQDEPEPEARPASQAMVPAGTDTTAVDTAVADVLTDPQNPGTSETDAVPTDAPEATLHEPLRAETAEPVAHSRTKVTAGTGEYSLQLGSFRSAANARAEVERIAAFGHTTEVEVATLGGQTYHRVVLRGLADRAAAERLGEDISSQLGITYLIRRK